jgi:SAM-dependent methyltransferase
LKKGFFLFRRVIASMSPDLFHEAVDTRWDDDRVLPPEFGPDTAFVFAEMTAQTLRAVDARSGERILDVGCGRALDLAALHNKGAHLVGLDGSRVMIRKAAASGKGIRFFSLSHGSAEHLPFRDRSFHKVCCKGAIDHFYDPERALHEMIRVLRPAGRLILSVANFESLASRLSRRWGTVRQALTGRQITAPRFWEVPADHLCKFDYASVLKIMPASVTIERIRGVSLLWGLPHWGRILRILPSVCARGLLLALDRAAAAMPPLADILVIHARKTHAEVGAVDSDPDDPNRRMETSR